MKIEQYNFKANQAIKTLPFEQANIVLVFGGRDWIETGAVYAQLHSSFPKAQIAFCSTAGEIHDTEVSDNSLSVTAIEFQKNTTRTNQVNINQFSDSYSDGKHLIEEFSSTGLRHVIVLADGQLVNGSELVKGINDNLPTGVTVSGGLAGDGARFQKTLACINNDIAQGNIVAIGL